jgi:hypothetical protein
MGRTYAQAPQAGDDKASKQHTAGVDRFIDLLLNAAHSDRVKIVGSVRADFYDPLIAHPGINALLPQQQVLLSAMRRAGLAQTIVEPAKKVGLAFDPPDLVDRILDDAGEDEGMLPLLQFALKETWEQREGRLLTGDSYARSRGVREAIRRTAERTFNALSSEEQKAARQLFLRLVTPGEGQEDTRARSELPSEPADEAAGDRIGPGIATHGGGRTRSPDPDLATAAQLDRCQPGEIAIACGHSAGAVHLGGTESPRRPVAVVRIPA